MTNDKRIISTFKFGYARLTLKERPMVKSNHPRRFPAHDFAQVGLPSQTSRTNKKWVISTFKFGYARLTLKRPKVKSEHTRRFPAHDFLHVGLPSQTCRTNNKRVISTFKFGYPRLTLKEGPKVKYDHPKRFPSHDFQNVGIPFHTSRSNNKRVQGLILTNFLSTDNQSSVNRSIMARLIPISTSAWSLMSGMYIPNLVDQHPVLSKEIW